MAPPPFLKNGAAHSAVRPLLSLVSTIDNAQGEVGLYSTLVTTFLKLRVTRRTTTERP